MVKKFFYLAGLPRSGSTLLASILAQNPDIYTSPNSPLVSMLKNINIHLQETEQAKAFLQPTQRHDTLRHTMEGFYACTERPVIIDKSRAWTHPDNLRLLEEIQSKPVKIIAMVRDLPSVLASFLNKIHEYPNHISFVDKALIDTKRPISDRERLRYLFSPDGTVYASWESLKLALGEGLGSKIHIVEYDDLVTHPDETISGVYNFLELLPYAHDFYNIENQTQENDEVYNLPNLHTVRPKLHKTSADPRTVLGSELYNYYASIKPFWRESNVSVNPLYLHTSSRIQL